MSVTRRRFLISGVSSALAGAFGLIYVAPAHGQGKPKRKEEVPGSTPEVRIPFGAQQSPLFYFTRETFLPYVGGLFVARAGSKSASMTLVVVRDCTPKKTTKLTPGGVPETDSFLLIFKSAGKLTDLTTIFDIEHGALGEFPLFMTRRDGPDGTSLYEVVFNHLF